MEVAEIVRLFWQNIQQTTLLEIVAVVFGLLSVWYSKKVNILVFPTGIVSVLIYIYITFFAKLYADMFINMVYFVMSVYGWYHWTHPQVGKMQRPVSFSNRFQNVAGLLATLLLFFLLRYVLINFTDSNVPTIDALTTAIFIVGMWLMAIKKVENWLYWIVGDVISVPLYFYKGLVFTSFQFFVFLIIAVAGYLVWRKQAQHD
ncbi:MAG: nicotinamide riboside transporter PnuC [Bacteroidetes bacterium]|nr:nicotinamide riboside transporter PnuC [Bacteroidota bacterium]MBU1579665.1 nicotinamide riboside transporter PnuC [Bacteroidota bacterium]MBU2557798.1 nicotinamide riboside transporter PnuC [Bacteroidota bacterium]